MRITYITNARIPTEKAHGYQICKMCEEFARLGNELKLLFPARQNPIKDDLFAYYGLEKNFTVEKIGTLNFIRQEKKNSRLAYALQQVDFILRLLFVKIETDAVVYTRVPEAVFLGKLKNCKVIYECHSWPKSFFYKSLIKKADKIVVTTGILKKIFIENGFSEDNILIAADGVDLRIFDINISKEKARADLDLPSDKYIMGYSGNFKTMGEEKGIAIMIEAMQILKDKVENLMLVCVGGKKQEINEYKNIISDLGLRKRVILKERVGLDKLALYQKACDILLMPFPDTEHYRNYMSPLKMFEYMASGRPIITSDLPSVREVLNESNAFFVKPENVNSLAESVIEIIENPQISESRAAQALFDSRKYTWEQRADKILDFLNFKF